MEKPFASTRRGRLRALFDWLRGADAVATLAFPGSAGTAARRNTPVRIGHYAIARQLGEGGMGVVYAAVDDRLERAVALKTMRALGADETARRRFWREARAAASVNHPHVCQIHEIGEHEGQLFIAMELLDGEALADRMRGGAMDLSAALPIVLEVLDALSALHARGIVHRDLKPSNVFLTPRGAKLLDFGLARASHADLVGSDPSGELTRTGMVLGTPRYMAPEQVTGEEVDARSDLFAVGALLFEMLAGRPAFAGRSAVEILHATLYEQPPALSGSPAVAATDRVIRRALAKNPSQRPASAEAMARELRSVIGMDGEHSMALASALTRLVVLPFRVLRPDPETDFLAFSLPDAIATSLSSIGSLVVRSSAIAARFAGETPDLKAVAAEADVDRVVLGTLVRSGNQLRASTQLVEAPQGTLLTSHTVEVPLGDLFRLQDQVARRVVEALALPLTREPDSPAPNAAAYAIYLQANELARHYDQLPRARDLYQRCLELDPAFAQAWAQLGRCHRVIGKYVDDTADDTSRAEAALRHALELQPRLSAAHKQYAHLEADTGQPRQALARLLGQARRHGNDPELFAGLVHACRYCGLFEASITAHEEARRLDPNVPTSIEQTLLMTGDLGRLLSVEGPARGVSGDEVIRVIGLGLAGQREQARALLVELRRGALLPVFRSYSDYLLAWLERKTADVLAGTTAAGELKIMDDPEAIFQQGWLLCDLGEYARGLADLQRAVAKGYCVVPTLESGRAFDAVRGEPAFRELLSEAEVGREHALETFRDGAGDRLLGRVG